MKSLPSNRQPCVVTVQCPPVFGSGAIHELQGCMRKTRRAVSNSELIIRGVNVSFWLKNRVNLVANCLFTHCQTLNTIPWFILWRMLHILHTLVGLQHHIHATWLHSLYVSLSLCTIETQTIHKHDSGIHLFSLRTVGVICSIWHRRVWTEEYLSSHTFCRISTYFMGSVSLLLLSVHIQQPLHVSDRVF